MKILLPIICFFLVNTAYAQISVSDLKSGNKYFESKHKKAMTGLWKSNTTEQLKLKIKIEKRAVSVGDLRYSTDFIILEVRKFLRNGKDIASSFKAPIEVSSFDGDPYSGFYNDPVTGNNLLIKLKYINSTTLQFSAKFSYIGDNDDPKKGTIFSNKVIELIK